MVKDEQKQWRKYGMTYQETLEIMVCAGYSLSKNKKGQEILSPPSKEYKVETNKTAIQLWKNKCKN